MSTKIIIMKKKKSNDRRIRELGASEEWLGVHDTGLLKLKVMSTTFYFALCMYVRAGGEDAEK